MLALLEEEGEQEGTDHGSKSLIVAAGWMCCVQHPGVHRLVVEALLNYLPT
jgi:hypothetical protein